MSLLCHNAGKTEEKQSAFPSLTDTNSWLCRNLFFQGRLTGRGLALYLALFPLMNWGLPPPYTQTEKQGSVCNQFSLSWPTRCEIGSRVDDTLERSHTDLFAVIMYGRSFF